MRTTSVSLTEGCPKRKKILISLATINILCFFGIAAGVIFYVLSAISKIYDPPPDALLFLNITWYFVLFTPFSFVGGLAGTWISFGFGRYRSAYTFSALPLINIIGAPLFLQLAHVT